MSLIYSVMAIAIVFGLLAVYAPQIEAWNKKHLLSKGKK